MGTAPKYDWPAILDEVCEWLAAGGTIRSYSRQEGKPSFELIYRHVAKDTERESRIVRARALGSDAIAEEALDIADDSSGDTITDDEGHSRMDSEWVQRSKLRFEARMRLLSKWNSGRYGDKAQVEHSGKVTLDSIIAETLAKNAPPKAD
jgi:hypothetical protein